MSENGEIHEKKNSPKKYTRKIKKKLRKVGKK